MKKHLTAGAMRAMMFLLSAVVALGAFAGNTLSIENVTLNNTQPKKVAIMLDNDDPLAAALQFDINTPQGVNIVGEFERNDARFSPGQTQNYKIHNPNLARLIVICSNKNGAFVGNSGPIGYITVQATEAALADGLEGKIELTDIKISSYTGAKLESNSTFKSTVSVTDNIVSLSTDAPFVINPGSEHSVSLSAEQNFYVSAIQAVAVLPEGFKIRNDEVNKGARLSNGAAISVTPRSDGRSYGIVIYDLMLDPDGSGIVNGNSGELFNFTVVAPEDFTGTTAQIQFKDVEFADMKPRTVYAAPVSVTMTNGKTAYDRAMAEVESLRSSLSEALSTIAANSPDVKDLFPGTEISTSIDELESAVSSAYNDYTLTPDYDSVMSPADGIRAAIAQLIIDAATAQAEHEDAQLRQQKLDEANAAIAALENQLSEALNTIAENYPDVKDNFTGADLTAQINALKENVQEAFDNKTIVENYENLMAPVSVIQQGIAKLITDAQAAQEAHYAEVAAYNNAQTAIAGLESSLTSALETIAAECPDVKDNFKGEEITAQINTLRQAVEEARNNNTLAADYDNVMAPVVNITAAIATLISDAQAAQQAYNDEQEALRQLNEAKTNADAKIAELTASLNSTLATIAESCPDVKDSFNGDAIENKINILRLAVQAAFENKTLATEYESVMAPAAEIEAAIAKLLADAQAAQQAYDDEQEALRQLNEAKTNADAKIAELTASLNGTLATIAESCPDVKDNFKGDAITNQINVLKVAVQAAYDNKTLATNYESVMAPVAEIETAIAKLLADAQAAQNAFNEAEAALQQAYTNANTAITALTTSLNSTLATIAETCPDVKDNFKGEAITANIAALKAAVDKAFADKTLVATYDQVMAPVAGIEAAIAKFLTDAQAAQQAYNEQSALDQARTNANAALAALEQNLANALSTISTECPDVKQNFTGTEISAQITVLRSSVNAAYDNRTLADDYNEIMAPATTINAAIEQLIADARVAQQKFTADAEAEAARQEAYRNAKGLINELKAALTSALATIAETCPDVKDNFRGEAITAQINDLSAAVQDAYEEKTIAADYETVMAPAATIEAAIAQLIVDAQAAQQEYLNNKALEKAYADAVQLISSLKEELSQSLAIIAESCPDVKDNFKGEEISSDIEALTAAVQAAYENKTLTASYEEVMAPAAEIRAAIEQLVVDAQAAQVEFERVQANRNAYEADLAEIAAAQEALDTAVETIKADYPDYNYQEEQAAIQAVIDAQKKQADDALEAVENEGEYTNTVDLTAIDTMIESMMKNAKLSGVDLIIAEPIQENDKIFTMEGLQIQKVRHGYVNIIVRADGRIQKVYVK